MPYIWAKVVWSKVFVWTYRRTHTYTGPTDCATWTTKVMRYFATVTSLPQEGCEVLQSACLYVCLSAAISQNHVSKLQEILYRPYLLPVAVARSSRVDDAVRYVLPVLWMTSCFQIAGRMRCTARLTAEGCQSAGGNAERGGVKALKLRPSLPCLPLTDIPRP